MTTRRVLVSARLQGLEARFRPRSFMGDDLFAAYRQATEGARYDKPNRCQLAPVDVAASILARLSEAGFALEIDPELARAVQSADADRRAREDAAGRWARSMRSALLARGKRLYPFQVDGVEWLCRHPVALLADEMGLGKTIQVLTALPRGAPVLVVCPSSAKGVWQRETESWRPEYAPCALSGKASFRYPKIGELVIINYEVLADIPGQAPPGIVLVGDELHKAKNRKSVTARRWGALRDAALRAGGMIWGITGTPLLNVAPELWSVLGALGLAERTFGSWEKFAELMGGKAETIWVAAKGESDENEDASGVRVGEMGVGDAMRGVVASARAERRPPQTTSAPRSGITTSHLVPPPRSSRGAPRPRQGGIPLPAGFVADPVVPKGIPRTVWAWGDVADPAAVGKALRGVMLRRYRADVLADLPAKTYRTVECGLLPLKVGKAAKRWETADLELLEKDVVAFAEFSEVRKLIAEAKTEFLLEIVPVYEEQKEPLVVFSAHRFPIDSLAGREGWATITGDTPSAERGNVERAFQNGELAGVGLTIQAGGVALTLTRACQAIFVDEHWTPALNLQAQDRICRIGQNRGCVITRLVADHLLDRRIVELHERKLRLIDDSVERGSTLVLDFVRGQEA